MQAATPASTPEPTPAATSVATDSLEAPGTPLPAGADSAAAPPAATPERAPAPPVATADVMAPLVQPPATAEVPAPLAEPLAPAEAETGKSAYLEPRDTPWKLGWRVLSARYQDVTGRISRRIMERPLKIGVSARIFHPESGAVGLRSKTLQYLEESIAQWVMSRDVMVFMIPTVNAEGLLRPSSIRLRDYAKHLDGLVLQGGADVSPQSYSQAATRPEWNGDRARDMYELELLHEFVEAGRPVLGICRGCQLINVAFGGTLYQDIASDVPSAIEHVNDLYDSHRHVIHFPKGSTLAPMFQSQPAPLVNSIHHQAVKDLGRDVTVEAVSGADNIVEAIRYRKARFVMGLQWHPEFHHTGGTDLLDCTPILDSFLRAARETRF
ncbi:MAG: gamma-glutamyl-gamma-aminobutyrate hydrolase family protein [Noviherbaspirillum sp.]